MNLSANGRSILLYKRTRPTTGRFAPTTPVADTVRIRQCSCSQLSKARFYGGAKMIRTSITVVFMFMASITFAATFNISAGDDAALIAAIEKANTNGQDD